MSAQNWNFKKLILEEIKKNGGWVNAHVHADRAFTINPEKLDIYKKHDLVEKWDIVDEVKQNASVDEYYGRFSQALEVMIEQGVTVVGSFVDCDSVCEDRAILGALKARDHYKDQIKVKLINQPIKGLVSKEELKWFHKITEIVDIIGGLPRRDEIYHGKGVQHLDYLFKKAKELNKMIHVHVDQFNTPEDKETELLCDKTIEYEMQGKVVAMHGISIAAHTKDYRYKLYKKMRDAQVMMIACPNAWIDSKRNEILAPFHNSLTPVDELVPEKIIVGIGTDNICDYMVPFCDGEMWPELRLLATGCRFLEIDELVKIATTNGRKVLGLPELPKPKQSTITEGNMVFKVEKKLEIVSKS